MEEAPVWRVIAEAVCLSRNSRNHTGVQIVETELSGVFRHRERDTALALKESNPQRLHLGYQKGSRGGHRQRDQANPGEVPVKDLLVGCSVSAHRLCSVLAQPDAMAPPTAFNADIGSAGSGEMVSEQGCNQKKGQ